MGRKEIPEVHYRASRICRVLGNPTAYEILHLLQKRRMQPEEISKALGISMPTVSATLRSLRQLDLVRYIVKWQKREYWIKDNMVLVIMKNLENLVKRIKFHEY